MSRLRWLLSHPEFRRHPVQVSSGVVSWEIHKLLSRNMLLELDGLIRILENVLAERNGLC